MQEQKANFVNERFHLWGQELVKQGKSLSRYAPHSEVLRVPGRLDERALFRKPEPKHACKWQAPRAAPYPLVKPQFQPIRLSS
jgi:hypothetical protein